LPNLRSSTKGRRSKNSEKNNKKFIK